MCCFRRAGLSSSSWSSRVFRCGGIRLRRGRVRLRRLGVGCGCVAPEKGHGKGMQGQYLATLTVYVTELSVMNRVKNLQVTCRCTLRCVRAPLTGVAVDQPLTPPVRPARHTRGVCTERNRRLAIGDPKNAMIVVSAVFVEPGVSPMMLGV